MPIGTRSSIRTKRRDEADDGDGVGAHGSSPLARLDEFVRVLHHLGMEDQPIGAHGDQQHGGDVADPGDREERPHRQAQIEGRHVVESGASRPCRTACRSAPTTTNSSTSVANTSITRCQLGADVGPEQVDRDVRAAIGGRRDAPEDQDAEQKLAEVIGIGDLDVEEVAQQDRDEDVGRDDADEYRRDPLDRVDEAVHHLSTIVFYQTLRLPQPAQRHIAFTGRPPLTT